MGKTAEKMVLQFRQKFLWLALSLDEGCYSETYINCGVALVFGKEMGNIQIEVARVRHVVVLLGRGVWKRLVFGKVDPESRVLPFPLELLLRVRRRRMNRWRW